MTARKRLFLELLLTGPQTLRAFSAVAVGTTTLAPSRALQILEQMVEDGTVACSGQGMFSITDLGREDLGTAKPVAAARVETDIVPPRTYGNHAMPPNSLRLNYPAPARPAADHHKLFRSRGM